MQQKDDRIEELEDALRESVQINAEREVVLAKEEASRSSSEKQVCMRELAFTLPSQWHKVRGHSMDFTF